MSNYSKHISVLGLLIAAITIIVVAWYPTGDWVSEPLIQWFILIPLGLIQTILLLIILFYKKGIKIILLTQTILTLLAIAVMLHYINVH